MIPEQEQTPAEIIQKRVDNGIEFLNEELAFDWPWDLDTGRLDLGNMVWCVIGQLYAPVPGARGGWSRFFDLHEPSSEWMLAHGFDSPEREDYVLLTAEWKRRVYEILAH
jgi:hypothetical protein